VLLPKRNEKDLTEIPKHVLRDLDLKLVARMDEVLGWALLPPQGGPDSRPAATSAHDEISAGGDHAV
jgi:ATP-dependent Lon protease